MFKIVGSAGLEPTQSQNRSLESMVGFLYISNLHPKLSNSANNRMGNDSPLQLI